MKVQGNELYLHDHENRKDIDPQTLLLVLYYSDLFKTNHFASVMVCKLLKFHSLSETIEPMVLDILYDFLSIGNSAWLQWTIGWNFKSLQKPHMWWNYYLVGISFYENLYKYTILLKSYV